VDILSVIGIVLALVAVMLGAVLKGAGLNSLLSVAALTIVVVGTFAAISVQTPARVMKHAFRILPWMFKPPALNTAELIKKMVEWSRVSRKQGLLGLEPLLEQERDDFVRKGLQLVIDGSEPDSIGGSSKSNSTRAKRLTYRSQGL
jgi:chemotaxis protein MotA